MALLCSVDEPSSEYSLHRDILRRRNVRAATVFLPYLHLCAVFLDPAEAPGGPPITQHASRRSQHLVSGAVAASEGARCCCACEPPGGARRGPRGANPHPEKVSPSLTVRRLLSRCQTRRQELRVETWPPWTSCCCRAARRRRAPSTARVSRETPTGAWGTEWGPD